MSTRIAGFDLGLVGAVASLRLRSGGRVGLVDVVSWKLDHLDDDRLRYLGFYNHACPAVEWSDVVGYEHVQFYRGKSSIEGMRALLYVISGLRDQERLVHGVNVATLDSFISAGLDIPEHLKGKGTKKSRAMWALFNKHPELASACANDNEVDAVWVALYIASHIEQGDDA